MRIDEIKRPIKLYHGTLKESVPAILQHGLEPRIGEFTRQIYGMSSSMDPAVFAANRQGLERVVHAIVFAVMHRLQGRGPVEAGKYRMDQTGITDEEFFQYGAIVVLENSPMWKRASHGDAPVQAEPKDYWANERIKPLYAIQDEDLKNFLNRADLWPSLINDFVYETDEQRELGVK